MLQLELSLLGVDKIRCLFFIHDLTFFLSLAVDFNKVLRFWFLNDIFDLFEFSLILSSFFLLCLEHEILRHDNGLNYLRRLLNQPTLLKNLIFLFEFKLELFHLVRLSLNDLVGIVEHQSCLV